jgi:hypothetical protein
MPVLLAVMASFDPEVAHLPFDHARIGTVAAVRIDLVEHFAEQELIVIVTMGEGEKTPVSRFWTGLSAPWPCARSDPGPTSRDQRRQP